MKSLVHIVLGLVVSGSCIAETWTVDDDGKADFENIQAAINAASDGDEIIVSDGQYFENITFLGKEITVRSIDPPNSLNTTIIDGGGTSNTVVVFTTEGSKSVLDGFTITGGNTPLSGGGILIGSGSPTIKNCLIKNNQSLGKGGGIQCSAGSPLFIDCLIENNHSQESGGGVNLNSGAPSFINCTIKSNTPNGIEIYASAAQFNGVTIENETIGLEIELGLTEWYDSIISNCSNGGSILNMSLSDRFIDCSFTDNTANDGGGMNCFNGSPVLTGCIFENNTAKNEGGGMFNSYYSNPILTNCTFINNSAVDYGGGISNYDNSNPILTDCTFQNNNADFSGGGIANHYYSSPAAYNCTFTNNTASDGAGIFNLQQIGGIVDDCVFTGNTAHNNGGGGIYNEESSKFTILSSTFSKNIASTGSGGGIYNRLSSPLIENCIFNHNTAENYGGGIYSTNSSWTESSYGITYCTFASNTASSSGGAMYNDYSNGLKIEFCWFNENTAMSNGAGIYNTHCTDLQILSCDLINNITKLGNGGGIYNNNSNLEITSTNFIENHAFGSGGGMWNNQTDLFLDLCTLKRNTSDGDNGGGIGGNFNGNLLNCIFEENVSSGGSGGGLHNDDSTCNLTACTFNDNIAFDSGGGVYKQNCNSSLENCLFENNNANDGGGFFISGGSSTLNCIFINNSANEDGGAICAYNSSVTVDNSEFSSNRASTQSAGGGGGAIFNFGSQSILTVANSQFIGNNTSSSIQGGPTNYVLELTGSNQAGVVPHDSSINPLDAMTIELWITGNGYDNGSNARPISKRPGNSGCYDIHYASNDSYCTADTTIFGSCDGGDFGDTIPCGWTHLAVTIDGSTNTTRNYVNGVLVYAESGGSCTLAQGTWPLRFGNTTGFTSTQFYGQLDNIRIWSTALDLKTIQYWMTREITPEDTKDLQSLMGSWSFQSGMDDATGVNHGYLTGGAQIVPSSTGKYGGAIRTQGGAMDILESNFEGNSSSNVGGAILAGNSINNINSCTFTNNTTGGNGAGIATINSSKDYINNCTFSSNIALGGNGGGLYLKNDNGYSQTFSHCAFSNNVAENGAALYADSTNGGILELQHCSFMKNTANASGGGLCRYGDATLLHCDFDENIGLETGGGAYCVPAETLILEDCSLRNNEAGENGGGGIYIYGYGTLTNCDISNNNSIGNGGGIWMENGSVNFTELKLNSAGILGGGLYSASSKGILLQGCLICENEPDWVEGKWIDGSGNDFPVNCPNNCSGDYDSDNDVNIIDILGIIGDWGQCPTDSPCPGDFNADGDVNVTDLLITVGNWGPCE